MSQVTIEGSLRPSTLLARGERRTVELTDRVQRMIDRGYVVVIAPDGEPEPVDPTADQPTPPSRGASTDAWAAFLTDPAPDGLGLELPEGLQGADVTRAALQDYYDNLGG